MKNPLFVIGEKSAMKTEVLIQNWVEGNLPDVLQKIHETNKNIAIYERSISHLNHDIDILLDHHTEICLSGDSYQILESLQRELFNYQVKDICKDIETLLHLFKKITNANRFKLWLATVNTNMCRRFHTEINDLRLLCTYSGPGTLWLTEDNVNRQALNTCKDNECIVLDESKIQQAPTKAVVILKGAIYPQEGTIAVVHRSPTIEDTGQKRLLLRIDTNEFLNFDK